jgi:hypothetical protein
VFLSFGSENDVRTTPLLDLRMENKVFRTEFPFWVQSCKALSKLSMKFLSTDGFGDDMRTEPFERVVKRITERIGVEGHFEAGAWVWKAPNGHLMDWSQPDIGRVCPRPAKGAVVWKG